MRGVGIFFLLVLAVVFNSCIERYYLEEQIDFQNKLVVDATITDVCIEQKVVLSYTSTTDQPLFIACTNAHVFVVDKSGNQFNFEEKATEPGHYYADIDNEYLLTGNEFTLNIETEDGNVYKSMPEEMLPCPAVDSVYYEVENRATADPNIHVQGLQFFVDFNSTDYFGRYYRWIVEETYEFHSTWPKEYFITGWRTFGSGPVDYSTYTCYKTENVGDVFTLTTDRLTENVYIKSPLHFVSNKTQRLMYNYSVKLKQRSVSKNAYTYWNNIKQNNLESSGLFSKQPALSKGNVYNINDSSEMVLGYFGVSSETEKRLTIAELPSFTFENVVYCDAIELGIIIPPEPRPLYLVKQKIDGVEKWAFAMTECFDCTLLDGDLEKPDFFLD